MAETNRQKRRAEREEDARERIKQSGLLTHIINGIEEMAKLDHEEEGASFKLNQLNLVQANRFKLLNKITPDLKAQDINLDGNLKVIAIDMTGVNDEPIDEDTEDSPED